MPDDEILALHKKIDEQEALIGVLQDESESQHFEIVELEGEVKHLRHIIVHVSALMETMHKLTAKCVETLATHPF